VSTQARSRGIIYVENGVGRAICKALPLFKRNHGWSTVYQQDEHPFMQRPQTDDCWWIEDATRRGWVILTADARIMKSAVERACVKRVGARLACFGVRDYTSWDMMDVLTRQWDEADAHWLGADAGCIKLWRGRTELDLV
jgi:hypothetical protein